MAGGAITGATSLARSASIIAPDSARPAMPCGVMSGDIDAHRAIIWSKTDRPATMIVEYATDNGFQHAKTIRGALASSEHDFTARIDLNIPHGWERVYYRVRFESPDKHAVPSDWVSGTIPLPHLASRRRPLRFAFSGDECGQGWGINPGFGGYRIYESIRRLQPDFFIHSGDQIYADSPLSDSVNLPDGRRWENIVTPAKSRVAETLSDYRGNFAYNFIDENKRRLCAELPFLVQWDDHEVRNNWYPGQVIGAQETRYRNERRIDRLAGFANQAMFEYNPMRMDAKDPQRVYRHFHYGPLLDVFMLDERSYRGPNSANRQTERGPSADFLSSRQTEWLQRELKRSRATWKLIASDMPIALVVPDLNPDVPKGTYEAWANEDDGAPSGRELELAALLKFIKDENICNVVWVTADVHYAAATRFNPERAAFKDFKPFWEFVGGPLHAGTFGPNVVDQTFGPELKFCSVPADMQQNLSPLDGRQYFGLGAIDADTRVLTMSLHDIDGKILYQIDLPPES